VRNNYDFVVDVMRVPAEGNAKEAVHAIRVPVDLHESACGVVVLGGGTGGVAAAWAALRRGLNVLLTEETDWLGGQFTTQGVSALDEHEFIESFGGTASYIEVRELIRRAALGQGTSDDLRDSPNPGMCWVSNLAFEPRLAEEVLEDLLAPYVKAGKLRVLRRTKLVGATVVSGVVTELALYNFEEDSYQAVKPGVVIDATEFGDLLPLLGREFRVGAESVQDTGEPSAQPDERRPDYSQGLTYVFACERRPTGEVHTIPEPADYRRNRTNQPYTFTIDVHGGEVYGETTGRQEYRLYERMPGTKGGVWTYRRLVSAGRNAEANAGDVSMFNWPSNDYADPNLLLGSAQEMAQSLQLAKRLSLGFLYWLQTEAPTEGSKRGAPELLLRRDVMCTQDGLAKHPYVRESRRIVAQRTVVEQDVAVAYNHGPRARHFPDSVGIGWYPIDIHPSGREESATSTRTRPFQIPMGALIPIGLTNVIAGSKNIGTTHITNGCFRLHPVEWNIGESAGLLAAFSLGSGIPIVEVYQDDEVRSLYQLSLLQLGIPLFWEVDHPPNHPDFVAAQLLCMAGALADVPDLHFKPELPVSAAVWARVGGQDEVPSSLAVAVKLLTSQRPWSAGRQDPIGT
jgi:hypothetical protein